MKLLFVTTKDKVKHDKTKTKTDGKINSLNSESLNADPKYTRKGRNT